jgi:predicted enzyme related to lactoylglutathione lyase
MKPFDSLVTFCQTPSLEETHAFYNGLLRLPMVLDQGRCRIYRVARDAYIGFCIAEMPVINDGVMITLVTDEVDLWFQEIRNAGHHIIKPPALNTDYNIYHFFAIDPSGYTVEIQRFEDPRWKRE